MGRPQPSTAKPPPPAPPTDSAGWARAAQQKALTQLRLEHLVIALQDQRTTWDRDTVNGVARHLSDSMFAILYECVSAANPSRKEIIDEVHQCLWLKVLDPGSKDGQALRVAFVPRLKHRLKDAFREQAKRRRHAQLPQPEDGGASDDDLVSSAAAEKAFSRPSGFDLVAARVDTEQLLQKVGDPLKRLAYRLHVIDGVPFKSKKGLSIAEAVGVSDKTASAWVKEIQQFLEGVTEMET